MRTNRRAFLKTTAGASAAWAASAALAPVSRVFCAHMMPAGGYPLRLPPDFTSDTLTAASVTAELWPGFLTSVYALNGSVPGPTIRVKRGERLAKRVVNNLTEPLVLHWHGILAPARMDGNPRNAVAAGAHYDVDFAVTQRAGTYWYHAHTDRLTAKQAYLGVAGFFIVEDPAEAALGLPSGEFDVPLLIQDRRSTADHKLVYEPMMDDLVLGFLGDAVLVNGTPDAVLSVQRALYRFRLLNGSNARVFKIGLGNGASFKLIANDAGVLASPVQVSSFFLAPGQRAEVLINFADFPHGSTVELTSLPFAGDLTMMSTQGRELTLMRFVGQHTGTGGTAPATLVPFSAYDPMQAKRTRQFIIMMPEGGHGGGHGGGMDMTTDTINGLLYEMHRTDFTVPFDGLEIWEFQNHAEHMHPMHVHGALFQVVSRSSSPALPPEDTGWKDTVLVFPHETVRVLVKFDAHDGAFVLHCHNLEHEDGGMMLNFDVTTTPPPPGPSLHVQRMGHQLHITWPANDPSYVLEMSPGIGHEAQWTPVSQMREAMGDQFMVMLDADLPRMFLRLARR
ncbi:MAG: multicopper oxidase domain-containing protein [Verrucomicrobia bacterium]|nr:multicopper oxidase domain-containing protein [Verrucomicrobiota bacterium]